jgi:hypothetical protein
MVPPTKLDDQQGQLIDAADRFPPPAQSRQRTATPAPKPDDYAPRGVAGRLTIPAEDLLQEPAAKDHYMQTLLTNAPTEQVGDVAQTATAEKPADQLDEFFEAQTDLPAVAAANRADVVGSAHLSSRPSREAASTGRASPASPPRSCYASSPWDLARWLNLCGPRSRCRTHHQQPDELLSAPRSSRLARSCRRPPPTDQDRRGGNPQDECRDQGDPQSSLKDAASSTGQAPPHQACAAHGPQTPSHRPDAAPCGRNDGPDGDGHLEQPLRPSSSNPGASDVIQLTVVFV